MHDDDPKVMIAEGLASVVGGSLATFGNLDTIHVVALVVLHAIYVAGLAIRLRLRTLARHDRDDKIDQ